LNNFVRTTRHTGSKFFTQWSTRI